MIPYVVGKACLEFNSFPQGIGQISPREGLLSCRLLPKQGQIFVIFPRPIVERLMSQAFVQEALEEENYTRPPPDCGELSGKLVKLVKCQYGLKQASRELYLLLVRWLVEKVGMEQCKAKPCVFRKIIKNEMSLMGGVHVDDIIVSGEHDICDEFFVG